MAAQFTEHNNAFDLRKEKRNKINYNNRCEQDLNLSVKIPFVQRLNHSVVATTDQRKSA